MKRFLCMLKKIINIQCSIKKIIGHFSPKIGIVLGSGLGALAENIEIEHIINYADLEGMPHSTVEGHLGRFIFGRIEKVDVVIMQGRFHFYEGWSAEEIILPVRVMKMLGVETLLLSNAAGGLNYDFNIGDIMLIKDHISFIPNPLIGHNIPELGDRFPGMINAYSPEMITLAQKSSDKLGLKLKTGVYIGVTGPSYETLAEINFYRMIGADAVGMSTVSEVIAAAHMKMNVFAVSVITNVYNKGELPTHKEVVENGNLAAKKLLQLFKLIIKSLEL